MNNVIWKKIIDIGIYCIDMKKFRLIVVEDRLEISLCWKLDVGIYFFLFDCRNNFSIKSNEIFLKVVKGKKLFFL